MAVDKVRFIYSGMIALIQYRKGKIPRSYVYESRAEEPDESDIISSRLSVAAKLHNHT